MKSIYKRYQEMPPVINTRVDVVEGPRETPDNRKLFTPISQAVMDYYQNLLKEHEQQAARHSKAEYRIF